MFAKERIREFKDWIWIAWICIVGKKEERKKEIKKKEREKREKEERRRKRREKEESQLILIPTILSISFVSSSHPSSQSLLLHLLSL